MISKELLSEVLGEDFEILSIKQTLCKIRHLEAYTSVEWCIHKVAHECKEWATEKGYEIVETAFMIRIKRVGQDKQKIWEYPREMQDAGMYFNPSFTFKACQWILDNKEKQ